MHLLLRWHLWGKHPSRLLMRIVLVLLLAWLVRQDAIAQPATAAPVYVGYWQDLVYQLDSLDHDKANNLIVSRLSHRVQKLDLDTDYLRDYLTGQLETNTVYREVIKPKGSPPLSWLSYPRGLDQRLEQDREVGYLLLGLDSLLRGDHRLPGLEADSSRFRLHALAQTGFQSACMRLSGNGGWETFLRKHPRCYGVVELSEVVFSGNGQRAAFFVQHFRNGLNGWGGAVFMKKGAAGWEPDFALTFWIS